MTQIKTIEPTQSQSFSGNVIALANKDSTIALYALRDSKGKMQNELKLSYSLNINTVNSEIQHNLQNSVVLDLSTQKGSDNNQKLIASKKDIHNVWDLAQVDSGPILNLQCESASRCVKWSPLHSGMDYFIRSTFDGNLAIYDLRQSNPNIPVWSVESAHSGAIRDIASNPFIPYWIATAGSDSMVNIWDIRTGKAPVIQLSNHLNSVNSISWSPVNCDILLSGGSDRRFNVWNLRQAPYYVVGTVEHLDTSVVSVGFTNERPFPPVFAVTASGTIEHITLTPKFLNSMTPSLYGQQRQAIKQVEKEIYTRNFEDGFRKAYNFALKLQSEEERTVEANSLLSICYQRQPPTEYSVAELARGPIITVDQFLKDLEFFSYHIPPNYPDHLWPSVTQKLMFDIEVLKLNLELEQCIRKDDVKELLKMSSDIVEFLKRDPNSIKRELLTQILSILMSYNYLATLDMGSQIARVCRDAPGLWSNLLLYPTMYEKDSNFDSTFADSLSTNQTGEGSLVNAASMLGVEPTGEYVGDQIEFLKNFYEVLWSPYPSDIVELFESNKAICISASAVRIYLSQLLIDQTYDQLFIKSSQFVEKTKGYPFTEILQRYMTCTIPKLQSYLKACYSGRIVKEDRHDILLKKNPQDSPYAQKAKYLGHAGNTLINIICNADTRHLPKQMHSIMATELKQIQTDLEGILYEIKSASSDGLTEVTTLSNSILSMIKKLMTNKDAPMQYVDLVTDYKSMLERAKIKEPDQEIN